MSLLHRRRLPPELAAAHQRFDAVLAHVERAKAAITSAVPVARVVPVPLAEGLFAFEEELRVAGEGMPSWRVAELAPQWSACARGIDEALTAADDLRTQATDLGFESLVGTIGDLIAPLEAFADADERFRELRR